MTSIAHPAGARICWRIVLTVRTEHFTVDRGRAGGDGLVSDCDVAAGLTLGVMGDGPHHGAEHSEGDVVLAQRRLTFFAFSPTGIRSRSTCAATTTSERWRARPAVATIDRRRGAYQPLRRRRFAQSRCGVAIETGVGLCSGYELPWNVPGTVSPFRLDPRASLKGRSSHLRLTEKICSTEPLPGVCLTALRRPLDVCSYLSIASQQSAGEFTWRRSPSLG